jgi:hypothetical protein
MKNRSDHQDQPEDKPKKAAPVKPLKVLSTSLGLMLAGHLLLVPALTEAAAPTASSSIAPAANPKLVEWSSDDVKAYYNPSVDWSIPLPKLDGAANGGQATPTPSPTPSPGTSGNGSTTIINNNNGGHGGGFGFGGGFGWDDLLLYHMIFNMGSPYSSSNWANNRPSYDYRTNQPYTPPASTNRSFANQPTADKTTPRTNSRTGSFSTNKSSSSSVSNSQSSTSSSSSSSKSTSTSSGSIGGKSSGFSSSSGG